MPDFCVTTSWLNAHGMAPTAAQFQVLGITWPASRGWKRRLVGTFIPQETRLAFETIGRDHRATRVSHAQPTAPRAIEAGVEERLRDIEAQLQLIVERLDDVVAALKHGPRR